MTDHAPDPGEHDMTDHTDLLDTVDVHLKWLHRPNPKPDQHPVDNHQSAGYLERLAADLRAETERADRVEVDRLVNFELHVGAIKRWHETCDAVLDAVIEHGTLAAVVEVVADWLDGSDALDDEVCDRIRRAQAKAATVDPAVPEPIRRLFDEQEQRREASPQPRPFCPTCEDRLWVPAVGHSAEHGAEPCPDCTPATRETT